MILDVQTNQFSVNTPGSTWPEPSAGASEYTCSTWPRTHPHHGLPCSDQPLGRVRNGRRDGSGPRQSVQLHLRHRLVLGMRVSGRPSILGCARNSPRGRSNGYLTNEKRRRVFPDSTEEHVHAHVKQPRPCGDGAIIFIYNRFSMRRMS